MSQISAERGAEPGDAAPEAASGPEWVVVRPPARLDALAAQQFRPELARLADAGVRRVVVDLRRAVFVDSAGLACLVQAMKRFRAGQGDLVLVRPEDDSAWRVFRLTKFDEVFEHGTELPVPHRLAR